MNAVKQAATPPIAILKKFTSLQDCRNLKTIARLTYSYISKLSYQSNHGKNIKYIKNFLNLVSVRLKLNEARVVKIRIYGVPTLPKRLSLCVSRGIAFQSKV